MLLLQVINRTANLIQGQPTKSSGLWHTTFLGSELSDQILYNRRGEYHRYLSTQTVLTVTLNENHFYVENDQEPIARKTEANFHTILFVSLALEMFCLTFLMFKLIFVPLFRMVERRILSFIRIKPCRPETMDDASEVTDVTEAPPIALAPSLVNRMAEIKRAPNSTLQQSIWD